MFIQLHIFDHFWLVAHLVGSCSNLPCYFFVFLSLSLCLFTNMIDDLYIFITVYIYHFINIFDDIEIYVCFYS